MTTENTDDSSVWEDAKSDEEAVDTIPYLWPTMYKRETEYKRDIVALLEESGWSVETEVWSDCGRGRVDIIAEHPAVGCIGIEVKRTNAIYRAEGLATGIAQLFNYRSYTFSDHDIDYWGFAPGFDSEPYLVQGVTDPEARIQIWFKRILVELQFGIIRRNHLMFGNYQGLYIPLHDPERVTQADLDEIDEYLEERKYNDGEYEPRW